MKQHILLLDLKNDAKLIEEYEQYHKNVWAEVLTHIKQCGIENMRIYRRNNRLVMLIDVGEQFSFTKMNELSKNNEKVQEWETLMNQFQQPLEGAQKEEKWMLAEQIFDIAS